MSGSFSNYYMKLNIYDWLLFQVDRASLGYFMNEF